MANREGLVNTESINTTKARHVHNRSRFNDSLSYRKSFTARFAEYTPSFEMDGVPSDSISVNSHDLIDSLSLKAPFKGSIRKVKESFAIPKMALLPLNWDRIYTQPVNGDDVPVDANCVLENFPQLMSSYWKKFYELVPSTIAAWPSSPTLLGQGLELINVILKCIILGEYVYSHGSLLNVCGYKASNQWHFDKPVSYYFTQESENKFSSVSYDLWFDNVIRAVFSNILEFKLVCPVGSDTETYRIRSITASGEAPSGNPDFYCSFRFFLEKMRENPASYITEIVLATSITESTYMGKLAALAGSTAEGLFETDSVTFYLPEGPSDPDAANEDMDQRNLNLSRLLAYQMVCAHFYTNSAIDVVYTAELYRQYLWALFRSQYSSAANTSRCFSWNGMTCPYDYLSEQYLSRVLYLKVSFIGNYTDLSGLVDPTVASLTDATDSGYHSMMCRFAAFAAIFGFVRSLRFGDYFVGSRPRPLAPINTDVSVNNNLVSVIDITRKQWAQKFANAVMRSRQKVEDYVGDLFGSRPAPDYHNPFFLSREQESIFGDEVQNTAEAQAVRANSRTALFASQAGRFTFTFKNDDAHPCIYLQIISFDVKRAYTRSVDRQFFELTRYDMFNPDFQYIGDQPVFGLELGARGRDSVAIPNVFAYQSRDMEYKQRFDVASGGFVENLPGWLMTDRVREFYQSAELTPDFIRSFDAEFDQFYLALTGYSLGSYFHLAIITDNNVDATRPMAVDPQILE